MKMEYTLFECRKCKSEFKTNKINRLMGGMNCPLCRGSLELITKYESNPNIEISEKSFDIRRKIVERELHYCRDITAQQMETILRLADEQDKQRYNKCTCSSSDEHKVIEKIDALGCTKAKVIKCNRCNGFVDEQGSYNEKESISVYLQRLIDTRLIALDNNEKNLKEKIGATARELKIHKEELKEIRRERKELLKQK